MVRTESPFFLSYWSHNSPDRSLSPVTEMSRKQAKVLGRRDQARKSCLKNTGSGNAAIQTRKKSWAECSDRMWMFSFFALFCFLFCCSTTINITNANYRRRGKDLWVQGFALAPQADIPPLASITHEYTQTQHTIFPFPHTFPPFSPPFPLFSKKLLICIFFVNE